MAQILSNTWFPLDPKIGVNLMATQTISVTTNPEIPGPQAALGDRVQGNNNSVWMFVKATTTVTSGNVVAITNGAIALNMTGALASSFQTAAGVAQFGGASTILASGSQLTAQPGDYFWACLQADGGLLVNCNSTCAIGSQLWVSATTAGSVQTTASTGAVMNIYANTAFTASGSCTVTDFICVGQIRATVSA